MPCIGVFYVPSWLGCHTTHIFNNIMHPLLILPYFVVAYHTKKIYEATSTHNIHNRDMNIFCSARTQSLLSANATSTKTKSPISAANAYNHTIQSIHIASVQSTKPTKQRSNSLMSPGGNDSGSFNFDSNALRYSSRLDKRLIIIFLICSI